ncbi:hypothetical protein Nepgr_001307 [Nepenthes gracilis]|uniref:Pectinesterase inhibitor domain-containing protein n=1 Tax=Nepenthes gracilis TaxID=150966 RepID=A0AAD3P6W1_NEPGR|nr:hypothetical protein Nepgr_001307 [Nepenthes gracilis]
MAFSQKSIFLFVSLLMLNQYVNGDGPLIKGICSKTAVHDACVECLNSDPQASDLRGYVFTSINCPLRQSQVAGHLLDERKASETDPSVKKAYDDCVGDLLTIQQSFLQAINGWSARDYKAAEDKATEAFDIFSGDCAHLQGLEVSADVTAALAKETAFIQNAQEVIKQIM